MAGSNNEYRDDEEIKEGRGWLPAWYTGLIWFGLAFMVVYPIWIGLDGWNQKKQYAEEVATYEKEHPVVQVSLSADGSNPYRGDAAAIARGEKHFQTICAACHKADATGLIGPNLTDAAWLHGNTDTQVYTVVMEGVLLPEQWKQNPAKGPMPAHKMSLGSQKVLEVMAWVASKNATLKAQ